MTIKTTEMIKRDLSDYLINKMYRVDEAPWDRDYEDGRQIAAFLSHWVMFQQTDAGRAQRAAALDWDSFLASAPVQRMHARAIMPELEALVYGWKFGRSIPSTWVTPVN